MEALIHAITGFGVIAILLRLHGAAANSRIQWTTN